MSGTWWLQKKCFSPQCKPSLIATDKNYLYNKTEHDDGKIKVNYGCKQHY